MPATFISRENTVEWILLPVITRTNHSNSRGFMRSLQMGFRPFISWKLFPMNWHHLLMKWSTQLLRSYLQILHFTGMRRISRDNVPICITIHLTPICIITIHHITIYHSHSRTHLRLYVCMHVCMYVCMYLFIHSSLLLMEITFL